MVTDDERDYMYLAYSGDPRMRINLGIRRRLAPLVDNNRRRIELLISLLFSFPGSPILYYGDEIGMGDNIYLGDRNGVRTPMQWNGDRNAGFSNATPARLYSPVIMDPVWGYEAINVEAQQSDPSSLLNWIRNMIALRKLFRVFGRGSIEFLDPANRKVLAYLRRDGDEQILCVANLSRFAQPVDLDLSRLEGMLPIEMLGYVEFPVVEQHPYRLTLAPYGFMWLELHPKQEAGTAGAALREDSRLPFGNNWETVLEGVERRRLETSYLMEYLPAQRWFVAKSRQIKATRVLDWAVLETSKSALALLEVEYSSGTPDTYLLTLGVTLGERAEELRRAAPHAVIAPVVVQENSGLLHDAVLDDETCAALLALIENEEQIPARHGAIRGVRGKAFQDILGYAGTPVPVRRGSAEQSNTSILFGDRFILKLFRRQEAGVNPECEIGRYLTEKVGFDRVPPFAGLIEYTPMENGNTSTLGVLQALVANEGDGWKWTIEELDRYYEICAPLALPENLSGEMGDITELAEHPPSQLARDHVGMYLDAAAALGRCTAELHLAMASPTDDPAFLPEPLSADDLKALIADVRQHASAVFDILKDRVPSLSDEVTEIAGAVLTRRRRILQRLEALGSSNLRTQRIRIHGDYHLGQILRVKTDFVILDFEGEPARSLAYRRSKQSPLKDVAGMVRSFSYGAYASLLAYIARHPGDFETLQPWARLWERSVSAEFVRAYRQTLGSVDFVPASAEEFRMLLDTFLLEKALYEVRYELNSRPEWLRIPLMGILSMSL